MFLDDLISSLKNKTLEFDCGSMELTQSTSSSPILFKGRGFVKQSSEDELMFRIYATSTNVDQFSWWKHRFGPRSGRLFEESDFFALTITDGSGTRWTASDIIPDCNWLADDPNPVISGKLHSVATSETGSATHNALRLTFFDEVELPYQLGTKTEVDGKTSMKLDHAKFSAANCDFLVRKQEGGFAVQVTATDAFDEHLHMRIEEALQYLTGKSVNARVRTEYSNEIAKTVLYTARENVLRLRLGPPLAHQTSEFRQDGWHLFAKYLEYILRSTPHPYWSHCSYHLHNAREASSSTADLWAVGVSVAIEGIANLLPRPGSCHGKHETKELIEEVLRLFSQTTRFQNFTARIRRVLSGMLNVRAEDRLLPLVISHHIDGSHIEAWRRLRNKHVHPTPRDLRNLTRGDQQELIDLIYKTTVLLYHITFYLIEYEGKYTDYAVPNWPTRSYPLSPEQ